MEQRSHKREEINAHVPNETPYCISFDEIFTSLVCVIIHIYVTFRTFCIAVSRFKSEFRSIQIFFWNEIVILDLRSVSKCPMSSITFRISNFLIANNIKFPHIIVNMKLVYMLSVITAISAVCKLATKYA